jgi:hypothetical protein
MNKIVPAGNADSAYNALVYLNNAVGVNNFRTTPASVTVQNATIHSQEFGDIVATSSINIGSGFTVMSNGQLNLSVGSGVSKKCTSPSGKNEPENSTVEKTMSSVTAFSIQTVHNAITVRYSLTKDVKVNFKIFTIQGQLIMEKDLGLRSAGSNLQTFKLPANCGHQMYAVMMRAGNMAFRQIVAIY